MKKSVFLLLGAGIFAFASCNKTEKTETDTAVVTETDDVNADYEAMDRQRATNAASQMATDLKLDADTAVQRKASTAYYTRATRRREVRQKYATDTTGMAAEMRRIDMEADQWFREMLNPQQYGVFETKRTTYYSGFEETDTPSSGYSADESTSASAGSETNGSRYPEGTTVKTKTDKDGDTKTEIEGPDGQTKIKIDADGETKIKTKKSN